MAEVIVKRIEATASRPNVLYLDAESAPQCMTEIYGALDGLTPSEKIDGVYLPDLGSLGRNKVDWDDVPVDPSRPDIEVLRKYSLQPRTIVASFPVGTRDERIRRGAALRHEWVHSLGYGELNAMREADSYLVRNGLPARYESDESRIDFLLQSPLYGEEAALLAVLDPDIRDEITINSCRRLCRGTV